MYFLESKHSTVLAEWKARSDEKIDSYYQEYTEWAKQSIVQLRVRHTSEAEVQKMISTIHKKLDVLAIDLFTYNLNTWIPDKALEEKFNEKWSIWLDEIPSIECKSPKEIEQQILLMTRNNNFKLDVNLLNQKLSTPLKKGNQS